MLVDKVRSYSFILRENGVIVLKGHKYFNFYETLCEAYQSVLGEC